VVLNFFKGFGKNFRIFLWEKGEGFSTGINAEGFLVVDRVKSGPHWGFTGVWPPWKWCV